MALAMSAMALCQGSALPEPWPWQWPGLCKAIALAMALAIALAMALLAQVCAAAVHCQGNAAAHCVTFGQSAVAEREQRCAEIVLRRCRLHNQGSGQGSGMALPEQRWNFYR